MGQIHVFLGHPLRKKLFELKFLGRATVVGIVSWGFGCGFPNFASVFSRVDFHLEWIHSAMRELRFPLFDEQLDPEPGPSPGPEPEPELPPLPLREYPPCGRNRFTMKRGRIVGGTSVAYGALPYQVGAVFST